MARPAKNKSPVRIIGSRELHQNLPGIVRELGGDDVRYVLTVHGRPRAVLVGADAFLEILANGAKLSEQRVALQVSVLLAGKNLPAKPTSGTGAERRNGEKTPRSDA